MSEVKQEAPHGEDKTETAPRKRGLGADASDDEFESLLDDVLEPGSQGSPPGKEKPKNAS